jgi:mannose-1-phosphate guanylyltransferase
VSLEDEILGTAGGIARARAHLEGAPLLVVNGDIVGDLPLDVLLRETGEGLTLAGTEAPPGRGTVGLGRRGEVVRLRGETFGSEIASIDYMGVARLGPTGLAQLPAEGCLIGDFALPLLRKGGSIRGVSVSGEFEDVGTPRAYLQAHLRRMPEKAGHVDESARLAEDVTVIQSYVGPGASVEGAGAIERCVVLAGARVRAPLRESIVTPGGSVMKVE